LVGWLVAGWDGAADGFNGFLLSMVGVYLFQQKKLMKHMSSYQLFRNGQWLCSLSLLTQQPFA